MSALIWKELRENARWALLAMLALGGAEIYALYHTAGSEQFDVYYRDGITLCQKTFLVVTMFGCAAVGIALGLLQVLPELKPDRWAALLHRPVSRGKFFWGKAIAGCVLYLFAAGIPFVLCVWLVATPGNFPTPFVPEMIRPGLADLIAGLAYYFAALLVALHGGNIAPRALPIFAAMHMSFFMVEEKLFRVAIEAAVAMALVLCIAGWGAIYGRDSLRSRPTLARLAFLLVVFYGACGIGDLVKTLGGIAGRMGEERFSAWDILDNGAPARLDYINSVLVSVADAGGKPFTDPKYRSDRIGAHMLGMNSASSYIGDSHGSRRPRYQAGYRESYAYLYAESPYSHPRFEQWFYLVKDRIFVGMLPAEKKAFATLGANGFAPAGTKGVGFAEDMPWSHLRDDIFVLAPDDSLSFAYLAKQEVVPVVPPLPAPVYGMAYCWASMSGRTVSFLGIAFGTGVVVYDSSAHPAAVLPYHHDADRWGRISVGVLASLDRFILHYEPSMWINRETRKSMPSFVETLDADGNVLASYTMPPLPPAVDAPAWNVFIAERMESPAFFFGEMLYRRVGAALGSTRLRTALDEQLVRNWKNTREIAITSSCLAVVLAAITFAWARRTQRSRRSVLGWTAFVLALSVPAFLVFWLAGERPRLVTCPTCGKPREIERNRCPRCGAGWPEPAPSGTEIFDATPI